MLDSLENLREERPAAARARLRPDLLVVERGEHDDVAEPVGSTAAAAAAVVTTVAAVDVTSQS